MRDARISDLQRVLSSYCVVNTPGRKWVLLMAARAAVDVQFASASQGP
jgi:hypothetical protein